MNEDGETLVDCYGAAERRHIDLMGREERVPPHVIRYGHSRLLHVPVGWTVLKVHRVAIRVR